MGSEYRLTLVTGGARSGKSRFGENLISNHGDRILYVATAAVLDEEMQTRVKKHRSDRPNDWITLEAYRDFDRCLPTYYNSVEGIFVDCLTLMVTRLMMDGWQFDWEHIPQEKLLEIEESINIEMDKLVHGLSSLKVPSVLITNETGCGIVPENRMAREFRDISGRVNQRIANYAHEVYWVVSGIPVKIKP
ncbi:MAG: bifunctional adenosylcobinamide kinase/adenosylcobinamide-phosphate guanylyltransferase [Tindallia sp. MSAO_Bac2]|nr:MAG: bifunctional adenosylcobinamide kinase/adenosylcobinamide-phosphate guanylyltransferase [Tindallia sp. MSAO_Bac2]